jgi:hypothetical protein
VAQDPDETDRSLRGIPLQDWLAERGRTALGAAGDVVELLEDGRGGLWLRVNGYVVGDMQTADQAGFAADAERLLIDATGWLDYEVRPTSAVDARVVAEWEDGTAMLVGRVGPGAQRYLGLSDAEAEMLSARAQTYGSALLH